MRGQRSSAQGIAGRANVASSQQRNFAPGIPIDAAVVPEQRRKAPAVAVESNVRMGMPHEGFQQFALMRDGRRGRQELGFVQRLEKCKYNAFHSTAGLYVVRTHGAVYLPRW